MKRISLDSSSIASIGYEPKPRELEIEFRQSGDVYLYFKVPEQEYEAFMVADSKGTYFNKAFKPKGFDYIIVSRGRR
jgi:hypothetical protein